MPKQKNSYPRVLSSRYGKVKIYRNANREKWETFVVTWSVGKHRNRKNFSDPLKAENHAETVLEQLSKGQPLAGQMTASDALYFDMCKKKLGGIPLMEAVDYYLRSFGASNGDGSPLVAHVRDAYLEDLKARKVSPRDLESVKSHLNGFCEAVSGPIVRVQAKDIDAYLQGRECSNRTRWNIRGSLCRMWNWAKSKDMLPRNVESAADRSSKYKVERSASPGIFTPSQFSAMLEKAEPRWIPYLAICAFAGLRHAEGCRLKWEDIHMGEKAIILGSHITKTNKRRVAHMPDNLVAWLESFTGESSGKICPHPRPNEETRRLSEVTGIPWVNNGMRHSYISYQMAILRDAAKVAEQCGNSASEVQSSYKANALESEAKKWFSITPESVKKL